MKFILKNKSNYMYFCWHLNLPKSSHKKGYMFGSIFVDRVFWSRCWSSDNLLSDF